MPIHTVKVSIAPPVYKAYAKIVALIDGGYSLTAADSIDAAIVLIFEKEVPDAKS